MKTPASECSVETALDIIAGKWKGVLLYHLQHGSLRFGELGRRLPALTQRVLTRQLREMEADGLILRTIHAQVPPRVDYSLTPLGQSLLPIINGLKEWGDRYRQTLLPEPPPVRW